MAHTSVETNRTGTMTTDGKIKGRDSGDQIFTKVDHDSTTTEKETLPEAMFNMAQKHPDFPILMSKSDPSKGYDQSVSISDYVQLARTAARSFIKMGLQPKAAVGIMGFNHPAWCISQFGAIFAGGMACGIYTTNTADICQFIINDCICQILVVENTILMTKIMSIIDKCPNIKAIIQYTGDLDDAHCSTARIPLYTWAEFLALGVDNDDDNSTLNRRMKVIKPNDVAVLIYTSGTTGVPKGVMLSHDNLIWTSKMALCTIRLKRLCHCIISYLPFSHVAANIFDIIAPIVLGMTVYFAQPDALKGSLGATIKEVRPTLFLGVPRVFEKIHELMVEKGSKNVGYRNSVAKQVGKPTDLSYNIANCMVFTKIKEALGFDRCIYIFSGAAPLAQQTMDYFLSLDIMIHQVYGMSESSGPHTIGHLDKIRIGSVGSLMKGAEMKIAAPDENGVGEVCMRGRHVFLGYYNAESKTKEVMDADGWLHSGDLGRVEDGEFLMITGRIKELIITAGGENIAPVPIEERIKENLPFISNAVLIGDKKRFLSCLLTLKTNIDPETAEPTQNLTAPAIQSLAELGIKATTVDEVLQYKDTILKTKIDDTLKNINKNAVSNAAYVQKWEFISKDFSTAGGELGPTMKLKRHLIMDMYADVINNIYK